MIEIPAGNQQTSQQTKDLKSKRVWKYVPLVVKALMLISGFIFIFMIGFLCFAVTFTGVKPTTLTMFVIGIMAAIVAATIGDILADILSDKIGKLGILQEGTNGENREEQREDQQRGANGEGNTT